MPYPAYFQLTPYIPLIKCYIDTDVLIKPHASAPMKLKSAISVIIGLLLVGGGIFLYFNSPPSLMQEEKFTVREGEPLKRVAARLKRSNLITSPRFFYALHAVTGRMEIKKGKYRIPAGSSSLQILYKFVKGKIITHRITIPEGYNIYQTGEKLEAAGIVPSGEFLYYAFNRTYLDGLGIPAASAEGYLFPDTYVLPEDSDARDVIPVMYRRQKAVLSSIDLSALKDRELSLHQVLTLASLIEKEAKIPVERVYISSVFHNRLRMDMKLDCDPTVRYAVKKFTGRISLQDLASNSSYNTYLRKGLPPTPICMPGKDAIEAALAPSDTDFFYFVARNDGSHYFSTRLKEHNRAVDYYQKGKKNGFTDTQKL